MSLALIAGANPRNMRESHTSFLTEGMWRIAAAGVLSKLSVRRLSLDQTHETFHNIGEVIDGPCTVRIQIKEVHVDDKTISVHAEKL